MSYYDILHVNINDDLCIIQQSYIKLLKSAKQLNLDVSLLNKAYNTLKNPYSRIEYDKLIEFQNLNNSAKINLFESQFVESSISPPVNKIVKITPKQIDEKVQNLIFERRQDEIENKYSSELYNGLLSNKDEYNNYENVSGIIKKEICEKCGWVNCICNLTPLERAAPQYDIINKH